VYKCAVSCPELPDATPHPRHSRHRVRALVRHSRMATMNQPDVGETVLPVRSVEQACCRVFRRPPRDQYIRAAVAALRDDGDREMAVLALRMEECGTRFTVGWPEGRPGEARPIPNRCWSRVCPCCAAVRGARLADRVVSLVAAARKGGRVPKLLTLTQTDRAGFPADVTVPLTNVRVTGCASASPGDTAAINAIGTVSRNKSFIAVPLHPEPV
jgi:hypothetical protein